MWELSASKRAGQISYVIDGIEEAMGELISALKGNTNFILKITVFKPVKLIPKFW